MKEVVEAWHLSSLLSEDWEDAQDPEIEVALER